MAALGAHAILAFVLGAQNMQVLGNYDFLLPLGKSVIRRIGTVAL